MPETLGKHVGSSDAGVPEGSAAPEEIKDDAHRVVGQLREFGYRISPSSRFGQYLTIIEGCAASGAIDHPLLPQALLEFRQLGVITRVYGVNSDASAKLQRVIKDPADPLKSKPETPGRDTQFELFLGALLDLGGCAPLIGEPDLVLDHDGVAVGIAAKRVKSKNTLRARIAGAIDQIEKSADRGEIRRGVVALEATSLANPDGLVAITESEDLTSSAASEQAARLGEGILATEISSAMDGHNRDFVAGVLVLVSAIQIHPRLGGVVIDWAFRSITFGTPSAVILDGLKGCVETGAGRVET